jgi:hypothetical protein
MQPVLLAFVERVGGFFVLWKYDTEGMASDGLARLRIWHALLEGYIDGQDVRGMAQ